MIINWWEPTFSFSHFEFRIHQPFVLIMIIHLDTINPGAFWILSTQQHEILRVLLPLNRKNLLLLVGYIDDIKRNNNGLKLGSSCVHFFDVLPWILLRIQVKSFHQSERFITIAWHHINIVTLRLLVFVIVNFLVMKLTKVKKIIRKVKLRHIIQFYYVKLFFSDLSRFLFVRQIYAGLERFTI